MTWFAGFNCFIFTVQCSARATDKSKSPGYIPVTTLSCFFLYTSDAKHGYLHTFNSREKRFGQIYIVFY